MEHTEINRNHRTQGSKETHPACFANTHFSVSGEFLISNKAITG
jgi:hypothetical protein